MALTTRISDTPLLNASYFGKPMRLLFGRPAPDGVKHIEVMHNPVTGLEDVRWTTYTGEKHSMPFELTDEGVEAVIVAMKLTC